MVFLLINLKSGTIFGGGEKNMELIGLLLPALIDLVNRKIVDSDLRFWVSVAICSVVGLGINFLTTGFQFVDAMAGFQSLTASIMSVFGLAQLAYKGLWEKSQVRQTLKLDGDNV